MNAIQFRKMNLCIRFAKVWTNASPKFVTLTL